MDYILGVDGGGTKTKAIIASLEGKVLAESTSGASSFTSVGKEKAAENLNQAIFGAAEKLGTQNISFKSSGFGFAGLNVEEDLKIYNYALDFLDSMNFINIRVNWRRKTGYLTEILTKSGIPFRRGK